ncbi:PH domain-containing protein [Candidatus Saccharibacteria bacterium]|nr:PH domain-containing protein [Candidatus Saccharibacteria bacterium]
MATPSPELSPRDQADHVRSVHDYPFIKFEPTEFVVIDVTRSITGIVYIWLVALVAFASIVGIAVLIAQTSPDDLKDNIAIAGFIGALGSLAGGAIATYVFRSSYFIVTNERIFARAQYAPFSYRDQNIEIEHIEDCSLRQGGVLPTLFNYGTIRLSTVGDEHTYQFTFVNRPKEQFDVINEVVHAVDEDEPTKYRRN